MLFSATIQLWLHTIKLLAMATLVTGTLGTFVSPDVVAARRFAYFLAGPAFGLCWILGFILTAQTGASLLTTWVLGAMALSFTSLQVVLFCVGQEGRRGLGAAATALSLLAGTIVLMVFKPG